MSLCSHDVIEVSLSKPHTSESLTQHNCIVNHVQTTTEKTGKLTSTSILVHLIDCVSEINGCRVDYNITSIMA